MDMKVHMLILERNDANYRKNDVKANDRFLQYKRKLFYVYENRKDFIAKESNGFILKGKKDLFCEEEESQHFKGWFLCHNTKLFRSL